MSFFSATKQKHDCSRRAADQPRDIYGRFTDEPPKYYQLKEKRPADAPTVYRSSQTASGHPVYWAEVTVDGKMYRIPTDKNGHVDDETLAGRFLDIQQGGKEGHRRASSIDLNQDSKIMLVNNPDVKADAIKEWWAHPNRSDIKDIDNIGSSAFNLAGAKRATSLQAQRHIAIVGGTPEQRRMIRQTYDRCFTAGEVSKMARTHDCVVRIVSPAELRAGTAGCFLPETGHIHCASNNLDDPTCIIHESVHKLRFNDTERTGRWSRSFIPKNLSDGSWNSHCAEEAATEAETVARTTPYSHFKNASYYAWTNSGQAHRLGSRQGQIPHEVAIQRMNEDRRLFVGSAADGSSGLTGKKAINSVDKHFADSHIGTIQFRTPRDGITIVSGRARDYKG